MVECEIVQSDQVIKEHLFGNDQIICSKKECPYYLEFNFDGYDYSFCKTKGEMKDTNLNKLEILSVA